MGEMFDAVVSFFKQDEWTFRQIEGQTVLQLAYEGEHGRWTCYAHILEERAQFVFYSVFGIRAPEAKRAVMSELITRANYGILIGNLEMDWSDGEIRYKTSLDVEGDCLSPALLEQLVYANVLMTDRYLPGIRAAVEDQVSPVEALEAVERAALAQKSG